MPSLPPIRNFNLKVIFMAHFVLIALSSMGFWQTSSYLFYNTILILLLVWSIYHSDQEEPLQLAIAVNGISIILDIFLLVMCYSSSEYAHDRISFAMCIIHLVFRPVSIKFLINNLEERSNTTGLLGTSTHHRDSNYQDLDKPQTSSSTSGLDMYNAQPL